MTTTTTFDTWMGCSQKVCMHVPWMYKQCYVKMIPNKKCEFVCLNMLIYWSFPVYLLCHETFRKYSCFSTFETPHRPPQILLNEKGQKCKKEREAGRVPEVCGNERVAVYDGGDKWNNAPWHDNRNIDPK